MNPAARRMSSPTVSPCRPTSGAIRRNGASVPRGNHASIVTRRNSCRRARLRRAAEMTTTSTRPKTTRADAAAAAKSVESRFPVPARDCALCPRLQAFRHDNRKKYPDWFNAPVPAFGDADAEVLIVGLAPGLQGANRTGRPFTGDYAGDLLYATLLAV